MEEKRLLDHIGGVLDNMPSEWLKLTTHRLDIYDERLAKTQFLERFEALFEKGVSDTTALCDLPTAYDYIRLGHPLSSILEWAIARMNKLNPASVIAFSSKTMPVLAILRKNALDNRNTRIIYSGNLPASFDEELLRRVYGYNFELSHVDKVSTITPFDGSTVYINEQADDLGSTPPANIDFYVQVHADRGSILQAYGEQNQAYISEIQHVRRRETIAMTPVNCLAALQLLTGRDPSDTHEDNLEANKALVENSIRDITGTSAKPLISSSGLSMQYALMMGLIHHAIDEHPGKDIRFVVPPNCYGGTNDQARRVAASISSVEVVDLPVDGENDMVSSLDTVLERIALDDAIPYIIVEIPTNPRVEVPDLEKLKEVLSTVRRTSSGAPAVDPVFILDQTFCPNVHFLGEGEILSGVRAFSYASGSKFPSGGLCTAGYCVANGKAESLLGRVEKHLLLCDNEATAHQVGILAKQLPSMNQRIQEAYANTREFVEFIRTNLPGAKINFVSEELAEQGFTPSVFSLDLPTQGNTDEEREAYKRVLNLKLINMMITEIPDESKYCVSYGQLKGCYWTIPATSTQGTTKEGDKDYIARVAMSANMDLDQHKKVFLKFVESI